MAFAARSDFTLCDKGGNLNLARKTVIAGASIAAVVGLSVWLARTPILYSHPLTPKHNLIIRASPAADPDNVTLSIT